MNRTSKIAAVINDPIANPIIITKPMEAVIRLTHGDITTALR